MLVIKWIRKRLKNLSPAAIREIIMIIILLCIAIALSIPDYVRDKELAAAQKEMLMMNRNIDGTTK